MNFWTSVLAVFIADAILSFLRFSAVEAFFILGVTSIIYLIVSKIIDLWEAV